VVTAHTGFIAALEADFNICLASGRNRRGRGKDVGGHRVL